jgi:hypothetical protein
MTLTPQRNESAGGFSMAPALQRTMESLFQADFGEVRIHVNSQPARRGALAYAHGNDLAFLPACYAPDTRFGRFVLGHELAHVIQQRQGRAAGLVCDPRGTLADALEREADRAGLCAARGVPVHWLPARKSLIPPSAPCPVVQCMKFKYMTERGAQYASEEKGTSIRPEKLGQLEAALMKAKADLMSATDPAARDTAKLRVEYFTKWLSRQDVELNGDGSINWAASQEQSVVIYDQEAPAQGLTMVHPRGGRFFTDEACTSPLETAPMVTHFSGPGKAIYVMSKEGHLHVIAHKVGLRHHSSPLAGRNVACAGELQVKAGALVWLTNKSGHYSPEIDHLIQVLHILRKAGFPMQFRLGLFSTDPATSKDLGIPEKADLPGGRKLYFKEYPAAQSFLDDLAKYEVPDYELLKLITYLHHWPAQKARVHANGWRWRKGSEKYGFYSIKTGAPIPHREVRRWFKSQRLFAEDVVQVGDDR